MLEKSLQTLITPGGKLDNDAHPLKRAQTEDALTYVDLIMKNSMFNCSGLKEVSLQSRLTIVNLNE